MSDTVRLKFALNDIQRLLDAVEGNEFEQYMKCRAVEIRVELERQLRNAERA